MKIILLQKIRNLGVLGDIIEVKSSFARNYLIPQGKAIRATKESIEQVEARRVEFEKKAEEILTLAKQRADRLQDFSIIIVRKASEEGKLFGSIRIRDIADAITEKGIAIDKSEVYLPQGVIREVGEYEVELQLHSDIIIPIKVVIEAEK